jgi:hypothetical protein
VAGRTAPLAATDSDQSRGAAAVSTPCRAPPLCHGTGHSARLLFPLAGSSHFQDSQKIHYLFPLSPLYLSTSLPLSVSSHLFNRSFLSFLCFFFLPIFSIFISLSFILSLCPCLFRSDFFIFFRASLIFLLNFSVFLYRLCVHFQCKFFPFKHFIMFLVFSLSFYLFASFLALSVFILLFTSL